MGYVVVEGRQEFSLSPFALIRDRHWRFGRVSLVVGLVREFSPFWEYPSVRVEEEGMVDFQRCEVLVVHSCYDCVWYQPELCPDLFYVTRFLRFLWWG